MRSRRFVAMYGLGLLLAAVCRPSRASDTEAVLRGRVRDAGGRAQPGAVVRLLSATTGRARYALADAGGRFGFLGLPPGEYTESLRPPLTPLWIGKLRVQMEGGEDRQVELEWRNGAEGLQLAAREGIPAAGDEAVEAVPAQDTQPRTGDAEVGRRSGSAGIGLAAGGAPVTFTPGVLPVAGRMWEAVEEAGSTVRDTTAADGDAAQNGDEAQTTVSAREGEQGGSDAAGMSADGLPILDNRQSVDGLSARQGFRGGPQGAASGGFRAGSFFAQGAVGRVRSGGRGYSAEGGGRPGAGLAVVSRGTEAHALGRLHGNVFTEVRDSGWAAMNPFSVVTRFGASGPVAVRARPADTDWSFGGALARSAVVPGLSERWRMGLLGVAETRQRREALLSTPQTADFFQLGVNQRALLRTRGVSEGQATAALAYLSGLSGAGERRSAQWLGFGRVDLEPWAGDRLGLSYRAVRSETPSAAGAQVAEGVVNRALGSLGSSSIRVDAVAVQWAHTFGPHWTHELAGQVARDVERETPGTGAGAASVPAVGPGGYAPQVTIGPHGFSFGTPASLGRQAYPDERRTELAESNAWRMGRHLLTVGGTWARAADAVLGATNREGAFLYDSGTTNGHAGGLVDWITDYTFNVHAYPNGACPNIAARVHDFCFRSYSQSFANVEAEFVTHEIAGYAEDAVGLRPNLRLSLGARWEYQLLPYPLAPNGALDAVLAGGTGSTGSTASAGSAGSTGSAGPEVGASTGSLPEDRNNVGPRASLVWAPGAGGRGGRREAWLTVHAGYGMYFGQVSGALLHAALTETGTLRSTTSIRITPTVETACPQVPNQGFGYLCSFAFAPVGVPAVAATRSVVAFARNFRLPAVQQASLGVERQAGHAFLRARYETAWATQLPETTDANIAPSTQWVSYAVTGGGDQRAGLGVGQSFRVPLYTARLSAKFGPVTAIRSNANATYHAGTVEAELRPWHGWEGRGSFTFSRAIDYGPLVGASPRQNGQFDPFTNGYDKGRSSLDRPWQVAGAVVYRSQREHGEAWLRGLLGGWGVSALGRAGSGAPYSYTIFGGSRLPGGYESINGSGGATYLPTVGRNTLRLPMHSKVDLRLARDVRLGRGERSWGMRLQADAFNLLNTVSWSRVETRAFLPGAPGSVSGLTPLVFQDRQTIAAEGLATPAFGTPLSSTTGVARERTLQMGAKLWF